LAKQELPSIQTFRRSVEKIPDTLTQTAFKTDYLLCGRIGEIINRKCPSDKTANPTGAQLTVTKETYTPDINNPFEFQTVTFALMTNLRRSPTIEEILNVKEEFAVFTVTTEKRHGWKREVAIPLNPEFEPWAQQCYNHVLKNGANSFPFTRQQMYVAAREAFAHLTYTIKPYRRGKKQNGEYLHDSEGNLYTYIEKEHLKNFANHAIRHLRDTELKNYYGLSWEERHNYGGWTTGVEERYGENIWRSYAIKLCKKR